MRLPAFAVLAFVASGCTVHMVEQPASPVLVAAAPQPVPVYAAPARPVVVAEPVASPAPVPPRHVERPLEQPPSKRPHVKPPRKPTILVYRDVVAPESRPSHLASGAPPTQQRRPQKVKRPEPLKRVSSTSVAKAQ